MQWIMSTDFLGLNFYFSFGILLFLLLSFSIIHSYDIDFIIANVYNTD